MHTSDATGGPEGVLAEFIVDTSYEAIPAAARSTAERAFVDTVGVTLAGTTADAGARAYAFVRAVGSSPDGVPLPGSSIRGTAPEAALAIGTAGHALDYDDLSWAMDGHPSVPLVPAILALAGRTDASGTDVLAAYAVGFETMCYLASPVRPSHYERGWHATSTFGTFGATAAAASLLSLDREEATSALCIAASMPAGLKRNFGSMTKPLHAGTAARSGVTAALLAADGFTADEVAISGTRGFFDLYADGAGSLPPAPGDRWALEATGINVKFYPCCYFTHTSIAATQALADEHGISPADVESIAVTASRGARDALTHPAPSTGLEAKFSMEYCVASALVREAVALDTFEEHALEDDAVQSVRERVQFDVDPALEYDSHAATVEIETIDGERLTREQRDPSGTHDNPLSANELREKFLACAERALPADTARSIHDRLASLREEESVDSLVEALAT